MRDDLLINAIGCIDGSLIDEAENYKPKRRVPVWIWAASAACLCVIAFIVSRVLPPKFSSTVGINAELIVIVGARAGSYIDYRTRAETGKVLITDELATVMDERDHRHKYRFSVRITDANGACRDEISYSCLLPIEISDDERMEFIKSGVVVLSREEINSIKCPPQMALIIYPSRQSIGEEYLDTVGKIALDVWVELEFDQEFRNGYEYIREYDRLDSSARLEIIEEQVARFFKTRYSVDVKLDEEFKKFIEGYDHVDIGSRHERFVTEISRFFYKIYTEEMINGELVKEYIDSFGDFALDGEFKEFLHEERVLKYVQKYASDNGISADDIEEYGASGSFRARLGTELIKKLLQDKRTRGVYIEEIV